MRVRANPQTRVQHRSFVLLLVVALLSVPMLEAQPSAPTDVQVEATFLYKFSGFVNWPNPAPNDLFSICILGHDPFGPALDSLLRGESVAGTPMAATRILSVQEARPCRIIFVSRSEEARSKAILAEIEKLPVLTVSDMPHFVDRGGMIQFIVENGRVRFEVNLSSAEKSGLTLSSQLLKVASSVKRDGAGD